MDVLYQKYVDNVIAANGLLKPQIEPDMTEEQALQAIRDNAAHLYGLHQHNNQILKEILFTKSADTLTENEAKQLGELASELFHFNRSLDTGIAYKIHQLLYAYAQYHEDINMMIKELYYQGITLFYLNVRDEGQIVGIFQDQLGEYFRKGASYLDRYEELEDQQTRNYILRCLGNVKYGLHVLQDEGRADWKQYQECFDHAMEVFESEHYRKMNPEIPWDTYVYTMHYDRTKYLATLRTKADSDMVQGVLASAEYVYHYQEHIAIANDRGIGARTIYVYTAARYHAGLATIQELLDVLFKLCDDADIHDFSSDNIWTLLFTPEYLLRYAENLSEEEHQALQPRLDQEMGKQREYLFLLPQNEYGMQVSRSVHDIATYLSKKDVMFSHWLLDYILACHPPTFVHSKMIALLTRRFCAQLAKVNPELLAGTLGIGESGRDSYDLEELLELAYESGLYHDLGKCMLLNYVGCYSRNLLDEEFTCIKMHPSFGCKLLEALQMEDMAQVAYRHHLSFDGRGGYPSADEECSVRVRWIADIVTVVDALDAGTDNVGRCYAIAKNYERLVGELRAGSGTRYAPEIVKLLDDPVFYEEIERFIVENRRRVYLEVYHSTE